MSTAKPRAWPPRTTRARATRPRPPAKRTAQICDAVVGHQQTVTLHPGDLGHLDKFRQDLAYLSSSWRATYSTVRAMTEGLNRRLNGHDLDLSDPKNRLAHGRVAQTILVALLVTFANDLFLDTWRHTHQPPDEPDTSAETFEIPAEHLDRSPLTGRSRPPPIP
ncbi:hypothetical protein [Nonomuraea sp. NPDC050691]|uniref:hypothetical protein n=1 Tax=Nonomuraea sp. NPDC050691 TaxID=3155661 RepID=UPI0033FA6A75